jgi:hypothetical protein
MKKITEKLREFCLKKELQNKDLQVKLLGYLLPEEKERLDKFKETLTPSNIDEELQNLEKSQDTKARIEALKRLKSGDVRKEDPKLVSRVAMFFSMQASVLEQKRIFEKNEKINAAIVKKKLRGSK